MHYLNALPRFLANLPFTVRVCIAVLVVPVSLVGYLFFVPITNNPSVLAIPTILVAWMLKRRGMLLCVLVIVVTTLTFYVNQYAGHPGLLVKVYWSMVSGTTALLLVGFLTSSQRDSFDQSNVARLKEADIREQQQQLNQLKDQFILNVNHELRTPLTAVYGYLEILLERNEQLNIETRSIFLKNAMYSCEELQSLVNNILGAVQIVNEKDYFKAEELAMAEVVKGVIEHFDPRRTQERPIHMEVPDYIFVQANEQYVRQILRNLLSNAFKYSPKGTPITISASLHGSVVEKRHSAPEICISVKDEGPGIPPDEIHLLFGQFIRLRRDLSGVVRGTGLGLYVSKQLVEAMGGTIWVESTGIPGQGSRFCFTLPCIPHSQFRLIPQDISSISV